MGSAMERKERDRNANEDDDKKDTNTSRLDLDSLPLDLKMVILTRLRAKSLMNLRCVSKMWYSIIRSQGLVDSFYTMSSKQSRFIVALSNGVRNQPKTRRTFFFSFSHDEGEESSSLVSNFEMAMPTSSYSFDYGCCTSSHGFLAVQPGGRKLTLCNPSTEQVIKFSTNSRFVGLGYDPIGGQHKVLFTKFPYDGKFHRVHEVLTLGGGEGWRNIEDTPIPYGFISLTPTMSVCINGVLYYGAYCLTKPKYPVVIVCFDVRSEKLSFIKAPEAIVVDRKESIFIEYKGKLAFIVRKVFGRFDLWILEDPEKHEWSRAKQRFVCPSEWDSVSCDQMCFPGTNKAGEIIMAPALVSHNVQPFYIFYYNVETRNIRRVRLLGIGDDDEFRRSHGFVGGPFHVRIAPQHVNSIAFFQRSR